MLGSRNGALSIIALGVVACLVAAVPPDAAAGERQRSFDPIPGVITAPPPGAKIRDRVFESTPRRVQRATASATENVYLAPDGSRVFITASDGYAPNPAADQALANFFGSLLHNFELDGLLHVYVATPPEVPVLCGGEAAACYFLETRQLIVVGEDSFGGLPTDYVTAHEYGHHIANFRSNRIFGRSAVDWGTKGWASYEGVCPGVLAGRYTLSTATSEEYFRHPGEAFAEAYAYYHYPGLIPWEWVSSLQPDQGSFEQIKLDVEDPWSGPERLVRRGRVASRGDRADTFHFKTPLDGKMRLKLRGPRGSDLDLVLFPTGSNNVIRKSTGRGSRERIKYIVCGGLKFDAYVYAFKGGGRYRLEISRP